MMPKTLYESGQLYLAVQALNEEIEQSPFDINK